MEDIKLWHGDCLELMQNIPAGSIDAIICDPPYGTTACKWDSVIDFGLMWEQLNRVIKPNGAVVLFGSEPFSSALRMSNIKNYKYDWVWDKGKAGNILNSNRQPLKIHENISLFYKKQCVYSPQKVKLKTPYKHKNRSVNSDILGKNSKDYNGSGYTLYTHSYPKSIQAFAKENGRKTHHPTQKPVPLMEYLIKTYTNEGETVLDFTMGSGTTGVACQNTKRKFIGIEQNDKYFNIAQERTTANRERLSQLLF